MNEAIPTIGHVHKPTSNPTQSFDMGLLDALGELACLLMAKGVVTPAEVQRHMEGRAQICRTQYSSMQALPSQTLAEVAALMGKPRDQAFPKDAQVIPFARPSPGEPERSE